MQEHGLQPFKWRDFNVIYAHPLVLPDPGSHELTPAAGRPARPRGFESRKNLPRRPWAPRWGWEGGAPL